MATAFRLPDVGEGIHEAEVVRWLISVGQTVQEFEPIVEVQTDKAMVELPAPVTGTVEQIQVEAGAVARVGDVLVVFGGQNDGATEAGALVQPARADDSAVGSSAVRAAVGRSGSTTTTNAVRQHRPLATPGVRYYARQQGVPLDEVTGTGRNGRILKSDVDAALTGNRETEAGDAKVDLSHSQGQGIGRTSDAQAPRRVPFRGIRKATAEHVAKAAFTAPHVTAFEACDVTELVALRKRWNERLPKGERLSYLPFLLKVLVSGLRAFPYLNARLDEEAQEIELLPDYHIGIAVDSEDGLFVPVLRHADSLSVLEIAAEIKRLVEGIKSRQLKPDELRGSTFTVTNMGPIGGLFATPILNYPEVGILGIHKIVRQPLVVGDEIAIREVMTLSLSFDHRVIDGATSVRFMNHLKALIEYPEQLMLELK